MNELNALKEMQKLNQSSKEYVIYLLLVSGAIKFEDIATQYTKHLESLRNEQDKIITDISFPASYFIELEIKIGKKEEEKFNGMKKNLALGLIKSKTFEGTPFEKTLEQILIND